MGPLTAGIGLLLFVLACFASGRVLMNRRPTSSTRRTPNLNAGAVTTASDFDAPLDFTTTPTRQRRQVRVVQRATMERRLREQARVHRAVLAKRDAEWATLLALVVLANQPRPVEERRPVAAAQRVVAGEAL